MSTFCVNEFMRHDTNQGLTTDLTGRIYSHIKHKNTKLIKEGGHT